MKLIKFQALRSRGAGGHCHGHALRLAVAVNYSMVSKSYSLKIKYSLKREGTFNRLTEDTTPGNSGNRTLCSNRWVIRGTLLQSILDNWAVFQELRNGILEGKVDLEIRGQVIGVQTQTQNFDSFFGI